MTEFQMHQKLLADTLPVDEWRLSSLRLMNDRRYPWFILVPRRPDMREIYDLPMSERIVLMEEISTLGKAIEEAFSPEKVNIAALGNVVPQLHVHVVGRFSEDPAWPNPIWGIGKPEHYEPAQAENIMNRLRETLRHRLDGRKDKG